ncbi:MAG: hypothetical protein Q8L36_02600 [bacterium]|nr:hypothetical protein [bacterium]
MKVIPVINCDNFDCVAKKIKIAREELKADWLHFDVAEKPLASINTWNDPAALADFLKKQKGQRPKIEVHLMVKKPEEAVAAWLAIGASRVIISAADFDDNRWIDFQDKFFKDSKTELGFSLGLKNNLKEIFPWLEKKRIKFLHILAVPAGKAGQEFQKAVIPKIAILKRRFPGVTIEADGGINPVVAKLLKAVGTDILTTSHYVFNSENPKKAFEELKKI